MKEIRSDIIIFGSGITGLWTFRRLRAAGYSVVLIENGPLGGKQTMASQGVLHGGLKYALKGLLSDASEVLAPMPERWTACLQAHPDAEMDLSATRVMSDHQILWTTPGVASKITGFFATKSLSGRVDKIPARERPPALDSPQYDGDVFKLHEVVVDVPSLVRAMTDGHLHLFIRGDIQKIACTAAEHRCFTEVRTAAGDVRLQSKLMVFAAGAGNEALMSLAAMESQPRMQRRPLHQVWVKSPKLPPFYSVAIGTTTKPPMVCTTHYGPDDVPVWYLGGDLAEAGVPRSPEDQIAETQKLLARIMPWIDLSGAQWATTLIDRAEGRTADGARPDGPLVQRSGEFVVAWPSKLVLAPAAADQILQAAREAHLIPDPGAWDAGELPRPELAAPLWESLFAGQPPRS